MAIAFRCLRRAADFPLLGRSSSQSRQGRAGAGSLVLHQQAGSPWDTCGDSHGQKEVWEHEPKGDGDSPKLSVLMQILAHQTGIKQETAQTALNLSLFSRKGINYVSME